MSTPDDTFDAPFDALLRDALSARPDPTPGTDLAARVLAMASQKTPSQRPTLAPAARPSQWPNWAASLAVAAVLALGVVRLQSVGSGSSQTTQTDTSRLESDAANALLPVGGVGLLGALAYLAARPALDTPQPLAA